MNSFVTCKCCRVEILYVDLTSTECKSHKVVGPLSRIQSSLIISTIDKHTEFEISLSLLFNPTPQLSPDQLISGQREPENEALAMIKMYG